MVDALTANKIDLLDASLTAKLNAVPNEALDPVYVDSNFSISTGKRYYVDTMEGAITGTLDGTMTALEDFEIIDVNGTFADNNFTLNLNSLRLEGKDLGTKVFSLNNTRQRFKYLEDVSNDLVAYRTGFNIGGQDDQYVQFGTANMGSSFTLTGWFKIPANGSNVHLFDYFSGNTGVFLQVNSSGALEIGSRNTSSQQTEALVDNGATYDDGTERFFALVKNSNTDWDVYVNGVLELEAHNPTYDSTAHANLRIGRDHASGYEKLYARQVAVWGAPLDGAGVTEAYNSGTPGDLSAHSDVANLDHWWKMEEKNVSTFEDEIGAVDGTYQNFDQYVHTDIASTSYETVDSIFEKTDYTKPSLEELPLVIDTVTGVAGEWVTLSNVAAKKGIIKQISIHWKEGSLDNNDKVDDIEINVDSEATFSLGEFIPEQADTSNYRYRNSYSYNLDKPFKSLMNIRFKANASSDLPPVLRVIYKVGDE